MNCIITSRPLNSLSYIYACERLKLKKLDKRFEIEYKKVIMEKNISNKVKK